MNVHLARLAYVAKLCFRFLFKKSSLDSKQIFVVSNMYLNMIICQILIIFPCRQTFILMYPTPCLECLADQTQNSFHWLTTPLLWCWATVEQTLISHNELLSCLGMFPQQNYAPQSEWAGIKPPAACHASLPFPSLRLPCTPHLCGTGSQEFLFCLRGLGEYIWVGGWGHYSWTPSDPKEKWEFPFVDLWHDGSRKCGCDLQKVI